MELDELIMLSAAAMFRDTNNYPADYREAVRKAQELWKVFLQMDKEK